MALLNIFSIVTKMQTYIYRRMYKIIHVTFSAIYYLDMTRLKGHIRGLYKDDFHRTFETLSRQHEPCADQISMI